MFNSLKYVKKLEGVGLSRNQAETHIEIMTEVIESTLATSQDLKDLGSVMSQQMATLRSDIAADMATHRYEISADMTNLRAETRQDMAALRAEMTQLESRLTIKLGTIVSLAIGIAVTLTKLI